MARPPCPPAPVKRHYAIVFALLAKMTPDQRKGLNIVLAVLDQGARSPQERVSNIIKGLVSNASTKRLFKVTRAFFKCMDLLNQYSRYMTPKAIIIWSRMLASARKSGQGLEAVMGVMFAIDLMIRNQSEFNLAGRKFAILLEVPEEGGKRFVDVAFVALKEGESPGSVTSLAGREVLAKAEVKWLSSKDTKWYGNTTYGTYEKGQAKKAGLPEPRNIIDPDDEVVGDGVHQMIKDIEISVERGENMYRNFTILPKDYPDDKKNKFLKSIYEYIDFAYKDKGLISELKNNIADNIRYSDVTRDFE